MRNATKEGDEMNDLKNLSLTLFLFLTSCASVNSVSLTPIPEKRNNIVTSEVSKTIFLAFNFNNNL